MAAGFLTLADLGKNVFAWELDFDSTMIIWWYGIALHSTPAPKFQYQISSSEVLPNAFLLNLYYFNSTNAANPPLLLILTDNFSDKTPYGNFTVADVSNNLARLGLPPLNLSAPSPLLPLIQGKNLLGGVASSDKQAIVGLITDDPNVGPPPADFNETFFLTDTTQNNVSFPGSSIPPNASVVFDITDNDDGSYSYDLFLTLLTDAQNKTLQTANSIKLVAVGPDGNPVPVYDFKFSPDQLTNALDSAGINGGRMLCFFIWDEWMIDS